MTNPEVRRVRVRLDGEDEDTTQIAAMLANLLPAMSEGNYQVGELSPAYPNRRGPGARRYFDLYILRHPAHGTSHATPGSEITTRRGGAVER